MTDDKIIKKHVENLNSLIDNEEIKENQKEILIIRKSFWENKINESGSDTVLADSS